MVAPTVPAVGTPAAGTTAATTYVLPSHQAGDVLLLACEFQQTTPPAAPTGWALLGSFAQGSNVVTIAVYWKRATSSAETNPQVPAASNHQVGFAWTVRGAIAAGTPTDFTPVGNGLGSGTTATALAGTTSVVDTRVFAVFASGADIATNQFSGFSGSLTGLTTLAQSSTTNGGGGGIAVVTGVEEDIGTTGNVTATIASSQAWCTLMFSIEPSVGVDGSWGMIPL